MCVCVCVCVRSLQNVNYVSLFVCAFFRWTGSNTNPRNNDGQGLAGTDRSNMVLLRSQQYPEGSGWRFGPGGKYGHYGLNYPMHLNNVTFLGLNRDSLESLAFLESGKS